MLGNTWNETQMLQPTFIILTILNVPTSSKPFATLFLRFQGRNLHLGLSETLSSGVLSLPTTAVGLWFLYLLSLKVHYLLPTPKPIPRALYLQVTFRCTSITPCQIVHTKIFLSNHPVLLTASGNEAQPFSRIQNCLLLNESTEDLADSMRNYYST